MYRRIMVVIGDQSWSDVPVKYAIALAADTGAELSILMVLMPPLLAGMSDVTACTLVVESIMAQSQTTLAEIAAIAEPACIAYTTHVRWGGTVDAILRAAEEEDCDLIIVGSHACTWRGHRWLRHVIQKLTTSAKQPLLVITEPLEETFRGTRWTRLLVVHDGSPEGEAAVGYACALAQEAALEVCLLHAHSLLQSSRNDPLRDTPSIEDLLAGPGPATTQVSDDIVLALGNTITAIVETATELACDVIILGAEPFRGWKRLVYQHTAEAVMAHTTLPLLLVNRLATYGCYRSSENALEIPGWLP
jgi:nucleotide-binding universal stress UspA family protein